MMPMRRRTFLAFLAALPFLKGGAKAQSNRLTRLFGPPLRSPIRRIFVAGPPSAVMAYVLTPERMLGWPTQLSAPAREFVLPVVRDLPVFGRLVGSSATVSVETLLSLKPDLILDVGTVDATYLSSAERISQQTGIPYALVDGRLTESVQQLLELGELLGVQERAQRLAAYARASLAEAARFRAGGRRPRVYLARTATGLETGLEGSINVEVIEVAGGANVAAAAGRGGLTRVSFEQLLSWQPDIILTQDAQFFQLTQTDPLWGRLRAVQNKQVYLLPSLPFGWLDGPPGVNRLIGLRWLVRRLNAGAEPIDWRAETRLFYRLFYGQEPSAAQLEVILKTL
ncbi:Fe(3+) dicitrate-binding periplasmic protein [Meiothermus granaticius NBRC 107808]|uniref:Fe(3+) dicitrate-binding periplasmic protein n=2 Tax=Meiothermus TaxID=65551 RepID=A0A399F8Q4_9DEIN|nr:Fe(3+) dicitrate-binding periplasmic protein [Meiothermus granaticius NBRC 107808]